MSGFRGRDEAGDLGSLGVAQVAGVRFSCVHTARLGYGFSTHSNTTPLFLSRNPMYMHAIGNLKGTILLLVAG